ncbi:MAG: TPM domain-containing protein [Acidobacteriota bacterium]
MLCFALLLTILPLVSVAKEVPFLGGRVNDLAGMIDDGPQAQLETALEQLETDTGAQLVVLTVPSLEGAVLEDYALEVASTWQLGRKETDDGVLVLVAKEERRIRIEVGYGLEGAIPDVTAKRIIDGIMTPRFREGDFSGGITEATEALAALVRGEAVELPEPESYQNFSDAPLSSQLMALSIFGIVIGVFSFTALFGQGGQSWFLYFFLMPFYAAFPTAFFGKAGLILLAAWIVGFPILRILTWHSPWGRSFKTRHPGLFRVGSSGGGWSSGGGFSGGGGSFGGGGASGGW